MVNRLIIAAAGSGKTTYLVRQAMQQSDSVLITTYTIANELEIRKKIVELNGFVPHNVTIQTWYSFLLQHGVRPFQGVVLDDKINGMILVNEKSGKKYDGKYGPVYFAEDDYRKFYFTDGMKMYSDKIAKFVCRCEKETKGRVSQRISRIYPKIYVDEIQDLAGYDLDIIKSLLQAECDVTMVGDPRQVTYHTHNEAKYKKYANGKIEEFIKTECKKPGCIIDKETLNDSYRNNQSICSYSSQLYEEYGETGTKQFAVTGHDGVFLVRPDDVDAYLEEFKPMQLREKRTVKVNDRYAVINMGEATEWLDNELRITEKYTSDFSEDVRKLKESHSKIDEKIRDVWKQIKTIEEKFISSKALVSKREKVNYAKARIALYAEMSSSGIFETVDGDIEELKEKIARLEEKIKGFDVDKKMSKAESFLSNNMNRLSLTLDFEEEYRPIDLNFGLTDGSFDIYQHQKSNENIHLYEMGSGANWVSCHIALFLSFLRFFATQDNSPMPLVMFFDQPSQVYFPQGNDKDEITQADLIAVNKMYKTIFDEINSIGEDTGILPQIIIVDHVDGKNLECKEEFERYIRCNWRNDTGLI